MPIHQPLQHSMLRRCKSWDYCAPRIYMITITLADRSSPLLGKLVIDSPTNVPPEQVCAHIEPSALGAIVQECWTTISKLHPQIRLLGLQLMEEHLHGVLYVIQRMPRPLGNVIGSFKSACTKAYRELSGSKAPLFAPGFQDTILWEKGQLARMLQYLHDNPKRAAVKRLFPDFFRHLRSIPFEGGAFTGFGNSFLLNNPSFYQVQVSRYAQEGEINQKIDEMMKAAFAGSVIVSPCISHGERQLAKIAFENKLALIALQNKGFAPLFKPPGQYFNACAEGRLLMLAPSQWPYTPGKKPMTRWEACVLNALAQRICGPDAAEIHYAGIVPGNLSELVAQAMGNVSPCSLSLQAHN